MKKYMQLMRIKHWIKNLLIFLPIVCAKMINVGNTIKTLLAFLAFSFMCSFVYIINDIRDMEKDKLHERKKKRPLPSGKIKKSSACICAIVLLLSSFILNLVVNREFFSSATCFLIFYMLVNVAYSFGMKNLVIIDVLLLATGFILRVYYGAAIINVEVSDWLFLTILNASLFLGLGKRKKELVGNKSARAVLEAYNEEFLDKFQYLTLALTLVFYSMWTTEQHIEYLFLTVPLLMVIFMRYCLIVEKSEEGDPTTILYEDKPLIISCIIYSFSMIWFLGGI